MVGLISYYLTYWLFSEEKNKNFTASQPRNLRGGDERKLFNLFKKIGKNRPAKVPIIGVLFTVAGNNLIQEIINIIIAEANNESIINAKGPIALLIKSYLEKNNLIGKSSRAIHAIIEDKTGHFEKLNFIKIKLRYILANKERGKRRAGMLLLFGILISSFLNRLGGLTLVFEALRNQFEQGTISEALYDELTNEALK
jgi:hypothetical protein